MGSPRDCSQWAHLSVEPVTSGLADLSQESLVTVCYHSLYPLTAATNLYVDCGGVLSLLPCCYSGIPCFLPATPKVSAWGLCPNCSSLVMLLLGAVCWKFLGAFKWATLPVGFSRQAFFSKKGRACAPAPCPAPWCSLQTWELQPHLAPSPPWSKRQCAALPL